MQTPQRQRRPVVAVAITALLLGSAGWMTAYAGSKLTARVMFQSTTVDDVDGLTQPGPSGTAVLTKNGNNQSITINIKNLPGDSFGVVIGDTFGTNDLLSYIAALDRGVSNDSWQVSFSSHEGAPLQVLPYTDLTQLAGHVLKIGYSHAETNDQGQLIVHTALQGLILPLTSHPVNVNRSALLLPPEGGAPNPSAQGIIKVKFQESTGRSVLDIRAKSLYGGQSYGLWLETDSGSFTNIGFLAIGTSGTTGRFLRDTKNGDALPLDTTVITNLTGRILHINDSFGAHHLLGVIP